MLNSRKPSEGEVIHLHTVRVRNIVIGEGRPKICVPIVGRTIEEIFAQARHIAVLPADIVEWRADWFKEASDIDKVLDAAQKLRNILADTPLLFTFRSAGEGGEKEISADEYKALNTAAAKSGCVDFIDVELFSGENIVRDLIAQAHDCGVKVIVSSHDFAKTPGKEELLSRMRRMQELGADLPKLAVMPACRQDVLTLLAATLEMTERYADRPVITMAMSGTGVISRLTGEFSGSSVTFGSAGQSSAPGQIPVDELKQALEILHAGSRSV